MYVRYSVSRRIQPPFILIVLTNLTALIAPSAAETGADTLYWGVVFSHGPPVHPWWFRTVILIAHKFRACRPRYLDDRENISAVETSSELSVVSILLDPVGCNTDSGSREVSQPALFHSRFAASASIVGHCRAHPVVYGLPGAGPPTLRKDGQECGKHKLQEVGEKPSEDHGFRAAYRASIGFPFCQKREMGLHFEDVIISRPENVLSSKDGTVLAPYSYIMLALTPSLPSHVVHAACIVTASRLGQDGGQMCVSVSEAARPERAEMDRLSGQMQIQLQP